MRLRTPIVCVLGHVDHGKTTFLDHIRGTTLAEGEVGAITQHIGATEIPIEVINKVCSPLVYSEKFKVPGLLFIDTPGHHAFTSLRKKGGTLADLAVLFVDIVEGFQSQTYEALSILRRFKTPFVVALNKIDRISGWRAYENKPFATSYGEQSDSIRRKVDERIYETVGKLAEEGLSSDRYDFIKDFQKNICIVPMSAKTGEGIPDLLLVLIGLAQRFLEKDLYLHETKEAVGSVLEVKEEEGLGPVIDAIIHDGEIRADDSIAVASRERPIVTKIRALLKPKPVSEIRCSADFKHVSSVTAAAGVRIAAPGLEKSLTGGPLRVVRDFDRIEEVMKDIESEVSELEIDTSSPGIIIKADTIGSLEALAKELRDMKIPIQKAEVGDVSKRDIIEAKTIEDPLLSVILGFNVGILPYAKLEAGDKINIFTDQTIYRLVEDYSVWRIEEKQKIIREKLEQVTIPGCFTILRDHVFRQSKPAVVGVKVLGGKIKPNVGLIRADGVKVGRIKSVQSKGEALSRAAIGEEVAIAIDGATIGRQIKENDLIYVDIPKHHVDKIKTELYDVLTGDENEVFERFLDVKKW